MGDKLKIICDGDSWVFGCEIVDPLIEKKYGGEGIHPGAYDFFPENDSYRIPRIFSTYLAKIMDAEVENLAWPADDNTTILNRTVVHLSKEYLAKGLSTDNLLVIVGWSSPERNSFWFKEGSASTRFRLWPNVQHFDFPLQKKFWEIYVTSLWNREEYLPRYVMNVLQLQNFCDTHNIKWICFNSFYQTPKANSPKEWNDLEIKKELLDLKLNGSIHGYSSNTVEKNRRIQNMYEYVSLWETINPDRFYMKDQKNNTFKSFIEANNQDDAYCGWHPSPSSHEIWAEELYRYIKDKNLI